MGAISILLALVVLSILIILNVPSLVSFLVASSIVIIGNSIPLITGVQTMFMAGFGSFMVGYLLIFAFGAIIAKILDYSGAADSIAKKIFSIFGEKFALLAIVVTAAILTYGGIGFAVVMMAVIPLATPICKEIGISKNYGIIAMFAGVSTFALSTPGSVQIHNLIPMKFLGTSATAGLVPGLIASAVEFVLIGAYLTWVTKRAKAKGKVFVEDESGTLKIEKEDRALPHWLLSISPIIIIVVLLNVVKLDAELALGIAAIYSFVVFYKFIGGKESLQVYGKTVTKAINEGFKDGLTLTAAVCLSVGFGAVVSGSPAFPSIVEFIKSISGNSAHIGTAILSSLTAFVTGSASGGIGIVSPIIAENFMGPGVNPEALHRIMNIAVSTLDSSPFAGALVGMAALFKFKIKDIYGDLFVTNVVIPFVGVFVCILAFSIF